MSSLQVITQSAAETAELGTKLAECVQPGDLIVLSGDLGAGKTCFAAGLARGLGVVDSVTSPTFTVMKLYESGRIPLYHFDLYRLDDAEQLYDIDFYELALPGSPGVALVEWGDMFTEVVQRADLVVTLRIAGGSERRVEVLAHTARGKELLKELLELAAFVTATDSHSVTPAPEPGSRHEQ